MQPNATITTKGEAQYPTRPAATGRATALLAGGAVLCAALAALAFIPKVPYGAGE